MKFLHLSDLHLGRLLHRYSLQEEQTELLERIRQLTAEEKLDAVLIAGDVYDRSIPPVCATQLLDGFLASLVKLTKVFVISGNHDQAERLAFLSGPLQESGLHISPAYRGEVTPVTLTDSDGPVDVWLLPFVKAATVRPFFRRRPSKPPTTRLPAPSDTWTSTRPAATCLSPTSLWLAES